tara:strand:+ start:1105 stop:1290 length:186 start_codon:yes stop_codon:yes gene_type:complete
MTNKPTQKSLKVLKKEYINSQIEIADKDFVNELLHNHYSNEVKNMTKKELKEHLENIGLIN